MPGYIEPTPEFDANRVRWAFGFAANLPGTGEPAAASSPAGVRFHSADSHLRAIVIQLEATMRRGESVSVTLARIALIVSRHPVIRVEVGGSDNSERAREWTERICGFAAWELVDEQARRDGWRLGPGARQKLIALLRSPDTPLATIAKLIGEALEPMPTVPNIVFIQPAEALPDRDVQDDLGEFGKAVRKALKGSPVRIREPLPQFDPSVTDDTDPRTIYGVERPRLLDADVLAVNLASYSSPGCHKAIEWLQSLGARILVFSNDGSGSGRGTGRGPFNTEYFFDLNADEMVAKVVDVYHAERLDLQAHAADRMRVRRENSRVRGMLADALAKRPNPPIGISADRIRELLRDVSEFETMSTVEWRRLIAYAGPSIVNIMDILTGVERQPLPGIESNIQAPKFVLEQLQEARDAISATDAEVDLALREMVAQFQREVLVGNPDPWKTFTRKWFIDLILRFRGRP